MIKIQAGSGVKTSAITAGLRMNEFDRFAVHKKIKRLTKDTYRAMIDLFKVQTIKMDNLTLALTVNLFAERCH